MRLSRGLIVGVAVLVGAVTVAEGVRLLLSSSRPSLTRLAAVIGTDFNVEPRLTGGFPPADRSSSRSLSGTANLSPDARIEIARIEQWAAASDDPDATGSVAVAYLLQGDTERAINTLERLTSASSDASALSNLSAAYLVEAEQRRDLRIEYLCRALEAAEHSIRLHPSDEARFNRALSIHKLSAFVGDVHAWNDYLTTERNPLWVAAADRFRAETSVATDIGESWTDRRNGLRDRAANGDRAFVVQTVEQFPEAVIDWWLLELVPDWAGAQLSGDASRTSVSLARMRLVADAIEEVTHDQNAADMLRTVEYVARHAAPDQRELAKAHLAYVAGIRAFRANEYRASLVALSAAADGFAKTRSPALAWTHLAKGTTLFQQRQYLEADIALALAESAVGPITTRRCSDGC